MDTKKYFESKEDLLEFIDYGFFTLDSETTEEDFSDKKEILRKIATKLETNIDFAKKVKYDVKFVKKLIHLIDQLYTTNRNVEDDLMLNNDDLSEEEYSLAEYEEIKDSFLKIYNEIKKGHKEFTENGHENFEVTRDAIYAISLLKKTNDSLKVLSDFGSMGHTLNQAKSTISHICESLKRKHNNEDSALQGKIRKNFINLAIAFEDFANAYLDRYYDKNPEFEKSQFIRTIAKSILVLMKNMLFVLEDFPSGNQSGYQRIGNIFISINREHNKILGDFLPKIEKLQLKGQNISQKKRR